MYRMEKDQQFLSVWLEMNCPSSLFSLVLLLLLLLLFCFRLLYIECYVYCVLDLRAADLASVCPCYDCCSLVNDRSTGPFFLPSFPFLTD